MKYRILTSDCVTPSPQCCINTTKCFTVWNYALKRVIMWKYAIVQCDLAWQGKRDGIGAYYTTTAKVKQNLSIFSYGETKPLAIPCSWRRVTSSQQRYFINPSEISIMIKLIAAVKKAISSRKTLDNRQGRFLTIYLDNGQRKNGKVLKPGYISSKVQLAYGPVIKVRNNRINLVATDHAIVKLG